MATTAIVITFLNSGGLSDRDFYFLIAWNSCPALAAVAVAYLMAVGYDRVRGVATGMIGAAVQCTVLAVCWGPLYDAVAGAALADFVALPPVTLVLSGVAMLFAGLAIYLIPIKPIRAADCTACGYDLSGLAPDALCPECGKPLPQRTTEPVP